MYKFHSTTHPHFNPFSQSEILLMIEGLVKYIISLNLLRGLNGSGVAKQRRFDDVFCFSVMDSLTTYLSVYNPYYQYSEHLDAFWHGCWVAGIMDPDAMIGSVYLPHGLITVEQIRLLVTAIAEFARTPDFRRQSSDRLYQTKENNDRIARYAGSLHARHSRLLVIRNDFGIRRGYRHLVGIDEMCQFLNTMISMHYSNSIFENLVGHVWKLEQGVKNAYHTHMTYYFPGSKHQCGWHKSMQIGDVWETITGGIGYSHSCNTPEIMADYERQGTLGVGMIRRDDPVACQKAINAVSYLAKVDKQDQYLRMKPHGRRTFGTGSKPR